MAGKVKFEMRIEELVQNEPDLGGLVEPLLIVRRVLREQTVILHRRQQETRGLPDGTKQVFFCRGFSKKACALLSRGWGHARAGCESDSGTHPSYWN
jgi:hypothetical protein